MAPVRVSVKTSLCRSEPRRRLSDPMDGRGSGAQPSYGRASAHSISA